MMMLKSLVAGFTLLVSVGNVLAVPTEPVVAFMPNGAVISTTVDPELRRITYSWDFSTLPGDYEQIDIIAPGPPAALWCATDCVVGAGITEAILSDAGETALQLKYEATRTPPRVNSVELTYNADYVFSGEFIDGSPTNVDGAGNVTVTFRKPVGGEDSMLWAFTPVLQPAGQINSAPLAHAGTDQTITVGEMVTLDASGSSDADTGDLLTYSWMLLVPTNSAAVLSDSTAVSPGFIPDVAGTYTASLTVNDGTVDSALDSVVISAEVAVQNTPPVAAADADRAVSVGETVILSGNGSSDTDGDQLVYSWSLLSVPAGSEAAITAPGESISTFMADVAGDYIAQLVVSDGMDVSTPATTMTTATSVQLNSPPIADAGQNQSVLAGASVALNGSGSSDADAGDLLTYSWSFTSVPTGSQAVLFDNTSIYPTFTADFAGIYVVQLVVNDGGLDSAPKTVTITARSSVQVTGAQSLYTTYCAGCHGIDARGGSANVDVRFMPAAQLQDALAQLHPVQWLPRLRPATVQLIASYLESPAITSPDPFAAPATANAMITWAANSQPVNEWWVYIGSTLGGRDYLDSGSLGAATSAQMPALPADQGIVYMRLWFRESGGRWYWIDKTYAASGN